MSTMQGSDVFKESLLREKYSYTQNILTSGSVGLFAEECQ